MDIREIPTLDPADIDLTPVASAGRLLVALDFDGVLAPLQLDPAASRPLPASVRAVEALSTCPETLVGYISGRTLAALKRLSSPPPGAVFAGSHGTEEDFSAVTSVDGEGAVPHGTEEDFSAVTSSGGGSAEAVTASSPAVDSGDREVGAAASGGDERPSTPALEGFGIRADDAMYAAAPTAAETAVLTNLDAAFDTILARTPEEGEGLLRIERKPFSRTFHTRGVSGERQRFYDQALEELSDQVDGARVIRGHRMMEFAVRSDTKGDALARMVAATRASAVVYMGDDVTDEDAFRALAGLDLEAGLAVKVGAGATSADARISDPQAVAVLLGRLAEERAAHV